MKTPVKLTLTPVTTFYKDEFVIEGYGILGDLDPSNVFEAEFAMPIHFLSFSNAKHIPMLMKFFRDVTLIQKKHDNLQVMFAKLPKKLRRQWHLLGMEDNWPYNYATRNYLRVEECILFFYDEDGKKFHVVVEES